MKDSPAGEWQKAGDKVEIDLKDKKYELAFRAMNLAGVAGPVHKVVIESK
jgi:hypothetical protein